MAEKKLATKKNAESTEKVTKPKRPRKETAVVKDESALELVKTEEPILTEIPVNASEATEVQSQPIHENVEEEISLMEEFHVDIEPEIIPHEEHDTQISDVSLEEMNAEPEEHDEEEDAEKYENFTKEQLVELLEQIVSEADVNAIKNKVARIKVAFWKLNKDEKQKHFEKYIAAGGKKDEYAAPEDMLEIKYNTAFGIYKEKRAKYLEEQEKEKQDNLRKKLLILEELKVLIGSEETLKKTYDDFKSLQERWKALGQVPRTEVNDLWQNYHFLVEKFFDKVKINNELKDLDLKKNFEKQLALCEKAEELLLEPSVLKSFKQLQKYHEEWKEIGPVLPDKKEELWERFKSATDRINQLRHEYYFSLHEEQEKNYIAKSALCDKVEQLNNSAFNNVKEWKEASDQVGELQKMWKTIGYTPKKHNNEIWERFRNALNTFYANRTEFFNKIKEEQTNNYNLKIALCVQAEALQESKEWKKTTSELINMQNEWKKIGPVPLKYSNRIWGRFRKACDIFFENKEKYFKDIDKNQEENLNLKLDIIRQINEFEPSLDSNENINKLKEFQTHWMNIGHVPSESKDKIYIDFKAAINKQFEKLKLQSPEKTDYRFKAKVDELLSKPGADKIIFKEASFYNNKINAMKTDIKLWENNMGFLANSKNADILKEEFTKKINSAKEHINQLQEKLKIFTEAKKNLKK
jgi:hypothetical protein